ncbi:MAG: ATP-binding protein [Planctomycetes bacterium]|nr:ATP-binding protein [Planctomycetota bacterium]
MDRIYDAVLREHLANHRQMLFLSGPRQVGKTTIAQTAPRPRGRHRYFNWDVPEDRAMVLGGLTRIAAACRLDEVGEDPAILVFDEIHKYPRWKGWLKGLFDAYQTRCRIVATGSARLDLYRRSGESLAGRYFAWRVHPLSLREIKDAAVSSSLIRPPVPCSQTEWESLMRFGGFPEPYLKRSDSFRRQWQRTREEMILRQDVRDLTSIREMTQLELLHVSLREQAGGLVNYTHLASRLQASVDSVRRWCDTLAAFYLVFFVRPWSRNVARSLLKEPKVYLWDWSRIEDPGRRYENLVASHLLKAVHFWTDAGLGDFSLHFLRDKEKREVDFLVARDREPWFLVEAKLGAGGALSPALGHFARQLNVRHAFEAAANLDYVDRDVFTEKSPVRVPARTLLAQLV